MWVAQSAKGGQEASPFTDDHSRKACGGQRVPACPRMGVGQLLMTVPGMGDSCSFWWEARGPHTNNFHSLPGRADPITLYGPCGTTLPNSP